jgi:hypothetical protein
MNEVELIREMKSMIHDKQPSNSEELMIETHPDGYNSANSGRICYLQAESKGMGQKIGLKLKQFCSAARERHNAQTSIAQEQQHVGKIYRSKTFQNAVAFLIFAECNRKQFLKSTRCNLMPGFITEFCRLRARRSAQKRWHHAV